MSAVRNRALPMAAMMMSACRVTASRSRVRVWQTDTVALAPSDRCISRLATGFPTILERPRTTTFCPAGSKPDRISICCMPDGVAGMNRGLPAIRESHVERVESVDILGRVDGLHYSVLIDLIGQRKLHQDTVYAIIFVQSLHRVHHFLLRRGP